MAKLTKRERSIASKFRKYEKSREQAKALYDRADRLLAEIAGLVSAKPCRIREDGRLLHIKDLSLGTDVIVGWGHGAVRRWELKVVDP